MVRPPAATELSRLLDRPIDAETLRLNGERVARSVSNDEEQTEALAIFRLGAELLALPAAALRRVTRAAPVMPIPHRRSGLLRGLCAVGGELVPCIDLRGLLGMAPQASHGSQAGRSDATEEGHSAGEDGRRTILLGPAHDVWAAEVDAVAGVQRLAMASMAPPPLTVRAALDACTRGVAALSMSSPATSGQATTRTVTVLDAERLLAAIRTVLT